MFDSPIKFGNIFIDSPQEIVKNKARSFYKTQMCTNNWNELYLCKDCHSPVS